MTTPSIGRIVNSFESEDWGCHEKEAFELPLFEIRTVSEVSISN
jgi:hypothetical protein